MCWKCNDMKKRNIKTSSPKIAAYVPYMTCPGNHEHQHATYSEYRFRFPMPFLNEKQELHFSFDYGPIHFVSLNVEVYYKKGGQMSNVTSMYNWLQKDLHNVDRNLTPWIVVFGHRPMYCAMNDWNDCNTKIGKTRVGIEINGTLQYGLEELLYAHNVDIAIWAHIHSYERMWPVYNYTVFQHSYVNAKAPIHINSPSAVSRFLLSSKMI